MMAAASYKVENELGDFKVVWDDEEKQQWVLQLPFPLLQQLLSSELMRVASEDTVLYTLERWCAWQEENMPPALQPTDAQLRELVGCVRMRCCSQAYVANVFAVSTVGHRVLQPPPSWELTQATAITGNVGKSSAAFATVAQPTAACHLCLPSMGKGQQDAVRTAQHARAVEFVSPAAAGAVSENRI
jgi:hypothetical protein